MRIAVNTRFLQKDKLEGIGRFTLEVLKRMVRQHPEHTFIFFFDRPYTDAHVFAKNIEPVVLFPPARHPLLFAWWFEWSVPAALRRYRADVFLSTDNFCSLRSPVPTVLVIHDLAYLHYPRQVSRTNLWYYRTFTPRFIRRAERIVTVSEFTKDDLLAHFPASPEKVDVACNGVGPEFRPLSAEARQAMRDRFADGKPYFIYVGALHPRKNVDGLIRAFDRFKGETGSDIRLLLTGRMAWKTGPIRDALDASVYGEDIRFIGYIPHEQLPGLIGGAEALSYVSHFEGFGIPILEAMHCEVPVITSNVSSMPEVGGDAVLYANPREPETISRAMRRLLDDPALRDRLARQARLQREQFSWKRASEVVYENILEAARLQDQ